MIRIALAEDDPASMSRLLAHLERFQDEHSQQFEVSTFSDGAAILRDYGGSWDVLLMDIEMPRLDGMTAAQRIREVDPEVIIVFITAAPQHAIRGYQVGALSYLLKPVTYTALEQELRRCLTQLRRRERRHLLVGTTAGATHRVDTTDILYVESVRHNVVVHTLEADLVTAATLKSIEAQLGDDGFFRCNNGLLVNLRHVTAVEGSDCRLRGGARLPVSRPRKRAFLAALSAHFTARGVSRPSSRRGPGDD